MDSGVDQRITVGPKSMWLRGKQNILGSYSEKKFDKPPIINRPPPPPPANVKLNTTNCVTCLRMEDDKTQKGVGVAQCSLDYIDQTNLSDSRTKKHLGQRV